MAKTELGEMHAGRWGRPNPFAGWEEIASVDESQQYEVDQTDILKMPDGRFALRVASGCSCWDGVYDVTAYDTVVELLTDIGPAGLSDMAYNPSFAGVLDLTTQCVAAGYEVPA